MSASFSEPVDTTLREVREQRYGLTLEQFWMDPARWALRPEAREYFQEVAGNTVDRFIHQYGPQKGIRITITVEAL